MTEELTLTGFLLARIAEDEAVARSVIEALAVQREQHEHPDPPDWSVVPYLIAGSGGPWGWDTVHIGPARVLAECEAKRRTVGWFAQYAEAGPETPGIHGILAAEGVILSALALPYAEHPDYRDEWRP